MQKGIIIKINILYNEHLSIFTFHIGILGLFLYDFVYKYFKSYEINNSLPLE